MTTGQRIALKRKEAGLSQETLGAELGVSRQSIYKWGNQILPYRRLTSWWPSAAGSV